jgi:hypothetical protein
VRDRCPRAKPAMLKGALRGASGEAASNDTPDNWMMSAARTSRCALPMTWVDIPLMYFVEPSRDISLEHRDFGRRGVLPLLSDTLRNIAHKRQFSLVLIDTCQNLVIRCGVYLIGLAQPRRC